MKKMTNDRMLRTYYAVTYEYLREHPEFDGRQHPEHPGMLRQGVDSSSIKPWSGAADVQHLSREEWIEARLNAVHRGDEVR